MIKLFSKKFLGIKKTKNFKEFIKEFIKEFKYIYYYNNYNSNNSNIMKKNRVNCFYRYCICDPLINNDFIEGFYNYHRDKINEVDTSFIFNLNNISLFIDGQLPRLKELLENNFIIDKDFIIDKSNGYFLLTTPTAIQLCKIYIN